MSSEPSEIPTKCATIASALHSSDHLSTSTVGHLAFYENLVVGETFLGLNIPVIHRAVSLPRSEDLDENAEYVLVNRTTGMLQYYEVDEIPQNIASVLGISVLVLTQKSISGDGESARHGVLHSKHLGEQCFVASSLDDGLCLALYEEHELRFKKKGSSCGSGYHGLVVPVDAMTLDDFVSRFCHRDYWQVCRFVAGGSHDDEVGEEEHHNDLISLVGVDTALGKLIKLLNAFGGKLSGSARRLANAIHATIVSDQHKSWDSLTDSMTVASGIYIFLHHLCRTLDPRKHVSSTILVESLQDSLNSKHGLQDEWEVVDLAVRVRNALLLPSLAALPIIVLYLSHFTVDTVFNSTIVRHLVSSGYSLRPVPANSVAVLLPLDNEKDREQAIHILRKLYQTSTEDGPLAISFGAHSLYDEENGELIFQLAQWDICTREHPPLQFTLKDCDAEKPTTRSKHRCSSFTKRGSRCKRMTFHESGTCWQHRIVTK